MRKEGNHGFRPGANSLLFASAFLILHSEF